MNFWGTRVISKTYETAFLLSEAVKLIVRGRWSELILKARLLNSRASGGGAVKLKVGSIVHIWSSPHTLFLANQIVDALTEIGVASEVIDKVVKNRARPDLEIVLSPAFFGFPFTRSPRIVFQLEQTTSKRWFTSDYVNYMNSSLAVFEYSLFNVERLVEFGVDSKNIFFVPLGGSTKTLNQSIRKRSIGRQGEKCIISYGDFSGSVRRARFAKYAIERISGFKIYSEIFGGDMSQALESSEVVVDVNYYSPGLLATPRIWESISHGCTVVSEKSLNWSEDPNLMELVQFVDVDDFDLLLDKATQLAAVERRIDNWFQIVKRSESRFQSMFARGLFSLGAIGEAQFIPHINLARKEPDHPIILSLPETLERYETAKRILPGQSIIFEGVKQSPGWIGCANSYRLLAKALLAKDVSMVPICEDDVVIPQNYQSKLKVIWDYLEGLSQDWDIFVGLTADYSHKTKILDVQEYKGETFIHSDRFTSTVFNIYSKRGLERLATWRENPNKDVEGNTLDRAISSLPGLRIISLERDLFGHDSSLGSTLWGHSNSVYDDMILRSFYIKSGLIRQYYLSNRD